MELKHANQSVQPFRTQDEYLYAMKEDLAEWLNGLYDLDIGVNDFFEHLENGVTICRHANNVQFHILQASIKSGQERTDFPVEKDPGVNYRTNVRPGTFQSRDNISNFIGWCRNTLQIPDTLLFETDDLVLRKNGRNVVLCLLEVARRGSKFGLPVPILVQLEQEIDAEIAAEKEQNNFAFVMTKRRHPAIKVDMKSLDELVRDVLSRCTCPDQFPMIRVSDGKYKIGDSLTMIFLRILRSHVMVRIGGGWDTLENYLNRHDPCRCHSKSVHGLSNVWNVSTSKENATQKQQTRDNNSTISETLTPDRKKSDDNRSVTPEIAQTLNRKSTLSSRTASTSLSGLESTFHSIHGAHPVATKRGLDAFQPRTSSEPTGYSHPNLSSGKTPGLPSGIQSDTRTNPARTMSRNRSNSLAKSVDRFSVESNSLGRTRMSLADSFYSSTMAQSADPLNQTSTSRNVSLPSSGTRAQSVDPIDRNTADSESSRKRPLKRASSQNRNSPGSKSDNDLIVIRNSQGVHRVLNSPENGNEKIRAKHISNTRDTSSPASATNRREQRISGLERPENKPSGRQRTLSRSQDSRAEDKENDRVIPAQDRKRSASFSSITQTASTSSSAESKSAMDSGLLSPLSPEKVEFLLEEYRKLQLDIRDLLSNAQDLGPSLKSEHSSGTEDVNGLDDPSLHSKQLTVTARPQELSTGFTETDGKLSTSKEQPLNAILSDELSSPGNSSELQDSSRSVCDSTVPQTPGPDILSSEEFQRTRDNSKKATSRHLNTTRNEPSKGNLTPVRSVSANRTPKNTFNRTPSQVRTENSATQKTTSISTGIEFNNSVNLSGHRSRAQSARNREKKISETSDRTNALSLHIDTRTGSATRNKVDRLKSRHSSVGAGERAGLHEQDRSTPDFLVNWDDYRKKVLLRKYADQGQRSSTRIPMPSEVKDTGIQGQQQKNLDQLKQVDSVADIH